MPDAPDPRGEVEIVVAGETYTLRPTFAAIKQLRRALGEPLSATTRRFYDTPNNYGPEEVEAVIRAAAVDKKPPPDLGDRIIADGVLTFGPAICVFLIGACTGGQAGKAAAPTTTPAPTTTNTPSAA